MLVVIVVAAAFFMSSISEGESSFAVSKIMSITLITSFSFKIALDFRAQLSVITPW